MTEVQYSLIKNSKKNVQGLQGQQNEVSYNNKRMLKKLISTEKSSKVYRSLIKIFLNNTKIPLIPPLSHNNEYIADFKEKAELFNLFFIQQYSLLKNENDLHACLNYLTKKRLSNINFSSVEIAKILANLNPNKAHGHDKITICVLQIVTNMLPSVYY